STSGDEPTIAWESNNFAKPQGARSTKTTRSVKVADLQELEEGTYFIKVDGYDAEGALLSKPRRVDPKDSGSRAENESERFLIVKESIEVEDKDVRAVFIPSLLDAWMEVASKALGIRKQEPVPSRKLLRGRWDEPVGAPPKGDAHFELVTEGFAGYTVVLPSMLRRIELSILEQPTRMGP